MSEDASVLKTAYKNYSHFKLRWGEADDTVLPSQSSARNESRDCASRASLVHFPRSRGTDNVLDWNTTLDWASRFVLDINEIAQTEGRKVTHIHENWCCFVYICAFVGLGLVSRYFINIKHWIGPDDS